MHSFSDKHQPSFASIKKLPIYYCRRLIIIAHRIAKKARKFCENILLTSNNFTYPCHSNSPKHYYTARSDLRMVAIKCQSVPALAERYQSRCGVIQIFPWGPQGIFGPSSDELNEKEATVASWD